MTIHGCVVGQSFEPRMRVALLVCVAALLALPCAFAPLRDDAPQRTFVVYEPRLADEPPEDIEFEPGTHSCAGILFLGLSFHCVILSNLAAHYNCVLLAKCGARDRAPSFRRQLFVASSQWRRAVFCLLPPVSFRSSFLSLVSSAFVCI